MARRGNKTKKSRNKQNTQVLALALIGAGLIVIAVLAFMLIPKTDSEVADTRSGNIESVVPLPVDFPAPDLNLTDLNGNAVSLHDYRGKVVLLNNWAIWCPPCKAEMPELQSYYSAHQDQGFMIIAIEAGAARADVGAFQQQYGLTFNVWPDTSQKSLATFKNMSLPNSYVLDRNGQVRLAWTGAISQQMLEKFVTPLLEE